MPASLSASTISGQISWWRRTYSSSYPGLTSRTHAYCAICPPSSFRLRRTRGRAVCEPLACVRVLVIQGRAWLEVQDDDGDSCFLDRGEDLRARRVGSGVTEDVIHPLFREPFARGVRFRGRVDEAWRDDRGPPADPLLDAPLVAFQPLLQPVELFPVGLEPDPKDPDFR